MDFDNDKKTYTIDNQFMFGPSIMVCPVTEYMYHHPPEPSVLIGPEFFNTNDGKTGLLAKYWKDNKHQNISYEQVEPNIDHIWYTGRPGYMTDSMFSVRWEGKLIPKETGKYQFHLKSYDAKRIFIDGKQLPIVYTSVEQYTDTLNLTAGKEYSFALELENSSTGAALMQLNWKTPSIFAKEKIVEDRPKTEEVYLPAWQPACPVGRAGLQNSWYDFWTSEKYDGGKNITADAPIDKIPLYVKAGSIIPMGPFLQYSTEKPADPIELRIYPGADASFVLYEDENDNYNYEKGIYATIPFKWNDASRTLTIGKRVGEFPGMLKERTFNIVLVSKNHGGGIDITANPDKEIKYTGEGSLVKF
jgi:alpha-D-xyloside xylohydrolase